MKATSDVWRLVSDVESKPLKQRSFLSSIADVRPKPRTDGWLSDARRQTPDARLVLSGARALILTCIFAIAAFAAQDLPPYTRAWIGTIGPWDLRLTLEVASTITRGHLRSNGVPGILTILGNGPKDSRIDCQVTDAKDQPLGRLTGRLGEDRGFIGRFVPADQGKTLDIQSVEIAEYLRQDISQGIFYQLTSSYPVFTDAAPLLSKLNTIVPAEISKLSTDFLGTPADRRNAITAMRQICEVEIVHASPTLVSLMVTQYVYSGGAHGNTDYIAATWTWLDGAPFRLDLPDLFTKPDAALVEIALCCAEDLTKQGASEASQVTSKPAAFFHNIAVSRNGLHVFFPPYAVGSYAEGSFSVTVPWQRLVRCMDVHGPLAELLPADLLAAPSETHHKSTKTKSTTDTKPAETPVAEPAPTKPVESKPAEIPLTGDAPAPAATEPTTETAAPTDEPKPKAKRKKKPAVQP